MRTANASFATRPARADRGRFEDVAASAGLKSFVGQPGWRLWWYPQGWALVVVSGQSCDMASSVDGTKREGLGELQWRSVRLRGYRVVQSHVVARRQWKANRWLRKHVVIVRLRGGRRGP